MFRNRKAKSVESLWYMRSFICVGNFFRFISYRDKLYLKLKRTPVDSERHNILQYNLKTYQSIIKRLIGDAKKQYYQKQFERYKKMI